MGVGFRRQAHFPVDIGDLMESISAVLPAIDPVGFEVLPRLLLFSRLPFFYFLHLMDQVFSVGLLVDLVVPHDRPEDALVDVVSLQNVELLDGPFVVELVHLLLQQFLVFQKNLFPLGQFIPPNVMEHILISVCELLNTFSILIVLLGE